MADTFDGSSEFPQEYARHVEMNTAARDKSAFWDNTRCRYEAEEEFSGTLRSTPHTMGLKFITESINKFQKNGENIMEQ